MKLYRMFFKNIKWAYYLLMEFLQLAVKEPTNNAISRSNTWEIILFSYYLLEIIRF